MVFNATFNNISVISWRSVLLVVKNWKKVFIFLGKTGKNELLQASKSWDIEYKQRVSVTSNDSIVIEINRLKKK